MHTLLLAEHDNATLNAVTLNAISAAQAIGGELTVLVAGENCRAVAEQAAAVTGVTRVLLADNAAYRHPLAENIAALLDTQRSGYSHLMAVANANGKDIMPRVAALADVAQISDIIAVESPTVFKRPIYAGSVIATVESHDDPVVLTVRASSFPAAAAEGGTAPIEPLEQAITGGGARFVGEDRVVSPRPQLATARVVVSGGRALGSRENFALIEQLADKLHGAVGASRAAVDAGMVPNDLQVGQTGKVVAPELYIAVGISGAIQHLAGMSNSKVIVAINNDEEAPIFQIADYRLVGDLFEVVPQLIERL
ncbi:electron transfer flavoprotein alpha subunit apoprotein [Gibbsiella quercinecans]|uniref:Electron transfer flavoprotein subunit alpha n=2 Tax=Gibbsiella TaxID=929812 RepID=A0A250AXA9_9GAMM|nr:FAD-binding protein [Gibbsiella quercinecans]ATA18456.1 electron transfer flavoprotein subunit beta [Gibbsiella quercinecans]RLM14338.1 electron transfer flavoprotein subunit beta [Gibbsiella quercinecans]TCT91066.1 electron transfer flavoprotein alpha subunit apoprotein [Gibbsiella quercinecans]